MNDGIRFYKTCLKIQEYELRVLQAKAQAAIVKEQHIPNEDDEALNQLYSSVMAPLNGLNAPKNYRELSYLVYLHNLAEVAKLFELYGKNPTPPATLTTPPTGYAPENTTFTNSDVAGWLGNNNQIDTLMRLENELGLLSIFIRRYYPDAKNIITQGVKFKLQLKACKTLSDVIRDVKKFKDIIAVCNSKSFVPVPGGLLCGSDTYWCGMYYNSDELNAKYVVPYMNTEHYREATNTPCEILKPNELGMAYKVGIRCYQLIGELAGIYNDIRTFRKFDSHVIFPANDSLLNEVLLSNQLDEEERYILLNYTNPGYMYLFFRFFTDSLLRYRRIADAIVTLIEHSTEQHNG